MTGHLRPCRSAGPQGPAYPGNPGRWGVLACTRAPALPAHLPGYSPAFSRGYPGEGLVFQHRAGAREAAGLVRQGETAK